MTFDPKSYKRDVLVPLAKDKVRTAAIDAAIRDLSTGKGHSALAALDLAALLAVDSVAPADLSAHLRSLRSLLNKWGRNPLSADKVRLVIKAVDDAGIDIETPEFWTAHAGRQDAARSDAVRGFVRGVIQENPLGVLTAPAFMDAARGAGLGQARPAALQEAARSGGLTIVAELEEPRIDVPPVLVSVVEHPQFRTLVDVITFPDLAEDVTVVDALSSGGRSLTTAEVGRAHERSQRARDSDAAQAAQKALGALKKQCANGADLHALVLAAMLKQVAGTVQPGGPRLAQRDHLTAAGLSAVDAARLVVHLNPAGGRTASASQLIVRALADGDLGEARRLADALPRDPEDDTAREDVTGRLADAEMRKRSLVEQADEAAARRDFTTADEALRRAAEVDRGDAEIVGRRAALPPGPPTRLSPRPVEGGGVGLSWPAVVGADVRYRVVRDETTVPTTPRDGHAVATGTAATTVVDDDAPIARTLHYAVFATRDGRIYSDPATASLTCLPPIERLEHSANRSGVVLSWTAHPAALGAQVSVLTAGAEPVMHEVSGTSLAVRSLELGRAYTFAVRAVYAVEGHRALSEPRQVAASPRGAFVPPEEFSLHPGGGPGTSALRASWRDVPGYDIELWALPLDLAVVPGSPLPLDDLERRGGRRLRPLPGGTRRRGTTSQEFPATGVAAYCALTIDGTRGVPGERIVSGVAPSATGVRADRLGGGVRLSWEWPDGDVLIGISWLQDGVPRDRRVTRAKYTSDGGVLIAHAHGISDLAITTIVRAGEDEWTSPPSPVPWVAALPELGYKLAIRKGMFRPPTATVTVDPGAYTGTADVELVLSTDSYLPSTARSGDVIARRTLSFEANTPAEFDLELPRKVPSPFWLKLFPAAGATVLLRDPPTSQMKG